jgi:hypothetical protein
MINSEKDISIMKTPQDKAPLSKRPLGYLIAVLGGALGGPIGLVMSPLALLAVNYIMKSKDEKQPNIFLAWSLIGILGAPLSIGLFSLTSESVRQSLRQSFERGRQAARNDVEAGAKLKNATESLDTEIVPKNETPEISEEKQASLQNPYDVTAPARPLSVEPGAPRGLLQNDQPAARAKKYTPEETLLQYKVYLRMAKSAGHNRRAAIGVADLMMNETSDMSVGDLSNINRDRTCAAYKVYGEDNFLCRDWRK